MSDTSYANVADKSKLIEIIDDEWIQDSLSDDEIEIPKDCDVNNEEEDGEDDLNNKEDTWNDLGLEKFNLDSNHQSAITSTTTSIQK